jgi:hypothetical protein
VFVLEITWKNQGHIENLVSQRFMVTLAGYIILCYAIASQTTLKSAMGDPTMKYSLLAILLCITLKLSSGAGNFFILLYF